MRTIIRDNYTPELGDYHERIIIDEAQDKVWMFDCDGVFTDFTSSVAENEYGGSTTHAISQKFFTDEMNKTNERIDRETSARESADAALGNRITSIESKIPNQASAENQLADKNFVNSSIATNTAYYISDNGQPFTSVADLEAYSGPLTNNDYAFVVSADAQGNTVYDRYKYNSETEQWAFEYELNNSSFTATQWAAINSGITSGDVAKIQALADIKGIGSNLTLDANGILSATNTTYTAGTGLDLNGTEFSVDTTTIQEKLTAGQNVQINNNVISATDTTYSDMTGATSSTAGTNGLVPAPSAGDNTKFLSGDGTWKTVSQYDLPIASASELGGIKVGANLTITADGTLSASGSSVNVVQTTGTSTTDVMSQNAVTEELNAKADISSLSDYVTTSDLNTTLSDYSPTYTFAPVAFSGNYGDLWNTPTALTTEELNNLWEAA